MTQKKELNLSDLQNLRGGLSIGKWSKGEKTETVETEGVPTCKCHTETHKSVSAS